MGAKLTLCCFHFYLKNSVEEKNAIIHLRSTRAPRPPELLTSDSSESEEARESQFGPHAAGRKPERKQNEKRRKSEDPRTSVDRPADAVSCRDTDRELEAFIMMRDRADKDTEEWEKLNYDIHTIRCARREVRARWRKILLKLGYQCEADSLLSVHRQSRLAREPEHPDTVGRLLQQLLDQTSLFSPGSAHHRSYVYVMDRLVSLDSAEDFVRLAKEKYPKIMRSDHVFTVSE